MSRDAIARAAVVSEEVSTCSLHGQQTSPVADEHGWRLGRIIDPFGHEWEIGKPLDPWPPT